MIIPLTKGFETVVDDSDFEVLSQYKWSFRAGGSVGGYASGYDRKNKKNVVMHRLLMGFPKDEVDHINGDKLDNRRANLRTCTHKENQRNRGPQKNNKTGYKGVSYCRGRATAKIMVDKKLIHVGAFDTTKEAAIAYNEAAKHYFGEYAWLNQVNP